MSRSLEVEVDTPTCISSGYCRNFAPDVFGARPDKKSYVMQSPVPESDAVREAWESCPTEAISARDAETGEDVFP
jgi:ferredoxin